MQDAKYEMKSDGWFGIDSCCISYFAICMTTPLFTSTYCFRGLASQLTGLGRSHSNVPRRISIATEK